MTLYNSHMTTLLVLCNSHMTSCDLLGSGEEVRMVAALLEVHHHIQQRHWLGTTRVQFLEIPCQDPPIVLPGMEQGRTHVLVYLKI